MQLPKSRLKEIAALHSRKYRDRYGEFIVEGERAVQSALDAGADVREIVIRQDRTDEEPFWGPNAGAAVRVVDDRSFERLSDVRTSQGVLAVVGKRDTPDDVLFASRRVLALDAVQDPGNVGTLVRTAAWFGVDAVMAGAGSVDFYNPKAVRASMGGLFDVHVAGVPDLAGMLGEFRSLKFRIVAATMDGAPIDRWHPAERAVLVVGNEGRGLSDAVLEAVDDRVSIPGSSDRRGVESLNVAQAASILMYVWTAR